ncbi:MAG: hypothetical protein V1769_05965 [Thermoplasmatota archaeon]
MQIKTLRIPLGQPINESSYTRSARKNLLNIQAPDMSMSSSLPLQE